MIEYINTTKQYKYNQKESILIIGEGSKEEIGIIKRYKNIEDVEYLHPRTKLLESYKVAHSFGVKNIFILNINEISHYIDISNVLMQYSFTYIVPIGIKISDTFVNIMNDKRSNFLNEYSKNISNISKSIFIYTDEHASLYESLDQYILEQNNKLDKALELVESSKDLDKHCFVLNNLKDYEYANVVLASALVTTDIGEYPFFGFGEAIFDLNDFDVHYSMVYFKNNIKVSTSIENAVNLREEPDAYKDLLVQRVINYIKDELDLSEFRSMLYTARVRLSVYEKTREFFISIMNKAIRGFKIKDIIFKKIAPGEGILIIEVDILPINFAEKTSIQLEV